MLVQRAATRPSRIPVEEVRSNEVTFRIEANPGQADYFIIKYHPVGNKTLVNNKFFYDCEVNYISFISNEIKKSN